MNYGIIVTYTFIVIIILFIIMHGSSMVTKLKF